MKVYVPLEPQPTWDVGGFDAELFGDRVFVFARKANPKGSTRSWCCPYVGGTKVEKLGDFWFWVKEAEL